MDVRAAMQGNGGLGRGLTTYPDSPDEEQITAHADCLALERAGTVTRHLDMEHAAEGARFVIWMPVDPNDVGSSV